MLPTSTLFCAKEMETKIRPAFAHLSLWAKQAASAGGDDDSSLSSENMGRRNGVVADKEMLSVK